jgi:hypothetical protein
VRGWLNGIPFKDSTLSFGVLKKRPNVGAVCALGHPSGEERVAQNPCDLGCAWWRFAVPFECRRNGGIVEVSALQKGCAV